MQTYTVRQVAQILGYSTNSIYAFLKEGRLKGVRVGKGRFRIPEDELQRVLHLRKSIAEPVTGQEQAEVVVDHSPLQDVREDVVAGPSADTVISPKRREIRPFGFTAIQLVGSRWIAPTLFDWMVGLSAIISGIGLFIFNQTYQPEGAQYIQFVLPYVRWILIASGVGILTASVIPHSTVWRRVFAGVLAVSGIYNTWALLRVGDLDGALMYGVMAMVVMVNLWLEYPGYVGVAIYLCALAAGTPILFWFGAGDPHISNILRHFAWSSDASMAWIFATTGAFLYAFWQGLTTRRITLWVSSLAAAGVITVAALFNAELLYWSRAFYLLTIAFFSLVLPIYITIEHNGTRRVRWMLQGLLAVVGGVFAVAVIVVGLLQSVVWEQSREEFLNKTTYGQMLLENAFTSVQSTFVRVAKNPEIRDALLARDQQGLEAASKSVYEGSDYIRRIMYLDADGNGIVMYPHGIFEQTNFAFEEYYQIVRETKKSYTSELFVDISDTTQRKVIVVAEPVLDESGEFVGAMIGSIDLVRIGGMLQAVAAGGRGEYYVVSDAQGGIVISPDVEKMGSILSPDDTLWNAIDGASGAEFGPLTSGELGMATYTPVGSAKWALSLRAPAKNIYTFGREAVYVIFGVLGVVSGLLLVWLWIMHVRIQMPELVSEGGTGP